RYGLVQHTRDLAQQFARDGYVCIAPDFFYKYLDPDALHRGTVGYDMTDPEAVLYLEAAIATLSELPHVDAVKIAAMRVCRTGDCPSRTHPPGLLSPSRGGRRRGAEPTVCSGRPGGWRRSRTPRENVRVRTRG